MSVDVPVFSSRIQMVHSAYGQTRAQELRSKTKPIGWCYENRSHIQAFANFLSWGRILSPKPQTLGEGPNI